MPILHHKDILRIQTAATSANLGAQRSTLLAGIASSFVGTLSKATGETEQLLGDLSEMNRTGALADNSVPLENWLRNAEALAGGRREAFVFRRALTQCMARRNLEIEIALEGEELTVAARQLAEELPPRPLGSGFSRDRLKALTLAISRTARNGEPIDTATLDDARALHETIFRGPLADISRRPAASPVDGSVLQHLIIGSPSLHAIPWEALCKPGASIGEWAGAPDRLPVRIIRREEPWAARELPGPLRVQAVTGGDAVGLIALKGALATEIASGNIQWLEPIDASLSSVSERLRREPFPHVLHFIGYCDPSEGALALRLGNDDPCRLDVKQFARELRTAFRGDLRLIVLEATERAECPALVDAAAILVGAGADAVVASLWPVKAGIACAFFAQLYRALGGYGESKGDICKSMNEARRAIGRAFAVPVLYLHGPESKIFDTKQRKVIALAGVSPVPAPPSACDPALAGLLRAPFSLLLGDRWKDDRPALSDFRDKLQDELVRASHPPRAELPMSVLTQHFALRRGADKLRTQFQRSFDSAPASPRFLEKLARFLGPGVHTTLLRTPWLEQCISEQHPHRTITVIQPGEEGVLVMRREGNGDWKDLDAPPSNFDIEHEIILLRPFRGYTPEHVFTPPLLTEDDYHLGLRELWSALPVDLGNAMLSTLSYRPALIVGVSMFTGHHRMALHRLHPRGLPRGSLVVVEPEDGERELWMKGTALPGRSGINVLETSIETLHSWIQSLDQRGGL